MPNVVKKVDGYQVRNKQTGRVHAKSTTKTKAEAQKRLLQGVEHGWKPTGKPAKRRRPRAAAQGAVVSDYTTLGPRLASGLPPKSPLPVIRTTREVITGRR